MSLEKKVKCDLCGSSVRNGAGLVVQVGAKVGRRDWRIEDYHPFDVCESCQQHKTLAHLVAVFAAADEGVFH